MNVLKQTLNVVSKKSETFLNRKREQNPSLEGLKGILPTCSDGAFKGEILWRWEWGLDQNLRTVFETVSRPGF